MGPDGAGAVRLQALWGRRRADGSIGSFSRLGGLRLLKLATDGVASCIKPAFAKAIVAFTVSLPVSAVLSVDATVADRLPRTCISSRRWALTPRETAE